MYYVHIFKNKKNINNIYKYIINMSKCDINKKNKNVIKTKKNDYPKLIDVNTVEECMKKYTLVKSSKSGKTSLKDTEAYKKLSPFGTYQTKSGKYNYGNKSYLKKKDLCKILMNPEIYFQKNIKECKKDKKYHEKRSASEKNRIRESRKGMCPNNRKPSIITNNCPNKENPLYKHKGLTTTGKECCYKRKMSKNTMNKRKNN